MCWNINRDMSPRYNFTVVRKWPTGDTILQLKSCWANLLGSITVWILHSMRVRVRQHNIFRAQQTYGRSFVAFPCRSTCQLWIQRCDPKCHVAGRLQWALESRIKRLWTLCPWLWELWGTVDLKGLLRTWHRCQSNTERNPEEEIERSITLQTRLSEAAGWNLKWICLYIRIRKGA